MITLYKDLFDNNSDTALYVQMYQFIKGEIVLGRLRSGERLPSIRRAAEESGLSVTTVNLAYEQLETEGYVRSRPQSGFYVSELPEFGKEEARGQGGGGTRAGKVPENVSDYLYDPAAFDFRAWRKCVDRVFRECTPQLFSRGEPQGEASLRREIARYVYESRGVHARPEQIVIGAGAEYLYGLLTEMLPKGRIWAIESPSYEKIEQVYSSRGIALDPLPLGQDGLVSEQLWRTEASILHVSPYRSYPSDVSASASKRSEYLRWGEQPERMIIEDDYESEFSVRRKPMEPLFAQSSRGNVIYLNTFSRTISSALRVGYMVIPSSLLPLYRSRVGFYSCTVPAFEQYVLSYLIDSGDFERHIRRVRRKLRASVGGPDQRA